MKELGGTLITLAAYSNAHYLHMEIAGVNELLRVWDKQEVIRKKQKEKPKGSPLPSPSTNRQVIAWEYELAHTGHDPATYGTWTLELSHSRPNVPEGSCRNLRPLYAD